MPTDLLKKYFRVFVKPIALTATFFIMITAVSLAYWPFMRPDPNFLAEQRTLEMERFSNPLFLLNSLFTGNFGFSSRTLGPVSSELAFRLPTTLLLIGLSIIVSVAVSLVPALLFKPRRQKPQTYAHSLRNFLFGATGIAGLLILWFFVIQPLVSFDLLLFPYGGLFTIPRPEDPIVYLGDVLWHLTLPVATIAFVAIVRQVLVFWSSGTPFVEKKLLKRLVFPLTTIDYALIVSSVVLVEYLFTLPGLGNMFLRGLGDYPNDPLAAFALLLLIGLGLGFLSTVSDFIQIRLGLRQDLDTNTYTPSTTTEQQQHTRPSIVKVLWRKKSLVAGAIILMLFLLPALFAFQVSPNERSATMRVAEGFAAPSWMKAFPPYRDYPETVEVSPSWDVQEGSQFVVGGKGVDGDVYATGDVELDIRLTSSFHYPYSVPPNRFISSFDWSISNLTNVSWSTELLITNSDGNTTLIWFEPYRTQEWNVRVEQDSMNFYLLQQGGILPHTNLAQLVFASPTKGDYNLTFHVSLIPREFGRPIKAQISLHDFTFFIPGLVYGVAGTDFLGADVFAQLVYGARTILPIALLISLAAVAIGLPFGFLGGYFQGWADNLMMVFPEAVFLIPVLPFILVMRPIVGRNIFLILWPSVTFLVAITITAFRNVYLRRPKGQKLKGAKMTDKLIDIIRVFGANLFFAAASFTFLWVAIDFLGFGDPAIITWGDILNSAFNYGGLDMLAWWWFASAIGAIILFTLGLFLTGHGLDED